MGRIFRSYMVKLPVFLLIGMLTCAAFAGVSYAQQMYWTDINGIRFEGDAFQVEQGQRRDIVLRADVPAGQVLKAFSLTVTYGTNISIAAIDKNYDFSVVTNPNVFPDGSGSIKIAGFDTQGVQGGQRASFIKLTIEGVTAGPVAAAIAVSEIEDYGTNSATQFPPTTIPLNVTVTVVGSNTIYWTDTNGVMLEQVVLMEGQQKVVRLKAGVPVGKILNAFKFVIPSAVDGINPPANIVNAVASSDADSHAWDDFNINTNPPGYDGLILTNGFATAGVVGPATVSFIDVTIEAQATGVYRLDIDVQAFGTDAGNVWTPAPGVTTLDVFVRSLAPAVTYWADTNSAMLADPLNLPLDGTSQTIRLMATVPCLEGVTDAYKTLNAYTFTLTYDSALINILGIANSPGSALPPHQINNATAGTITITKTADDLQGVNGCATIAFIDVVIQGKNPGTFDFGITANTYGSGPDDQFPPDPAKVTVNIGGFVGPHEVYWVNPATGARLTQLPMLIDGQATIRLVTEVPPGETLNAYSFILNYDETVVNLNSAVASAGSTFLPNNINTNDPGVIIINGFNTTGVQGFATIALIDVVITAADYGTFNFTINPDGYGSSADHQFPPTPVNLAVTVQDITPPPVYYTVRFDAGEGGAVDGEKLQTVLEGESTSAVNAVPADGYRFVNWIADDGTILSTQADGFIVANVTSDMTITANFAKIGEYLVIFVPGNGGSISGNLKQSVPEGGSTSEVTADANAGYRFKNWTGTGFSSTDNPLVITNVTSDMIITANFEALEPGVTYYTVTFTPGEHGEVAGNVMQLVKAGESTTEVTAVPNSGYGFVNWSGTGSFYSNDNPVIISNVQSDMDILANFYMIARPDPPVLGDVAVGDDGRVILTPLLPVQETYTDPTGGTLKITGWQIATDSGFNNLVLNIGNPHDLFELQVLPLYLEPDTRYFWRARFESTSGGISEWAAAKEFLTVLVNAADPDNSGVEDAQEIEDPNLDMNGNGIPDINEQGEGFMAARILLENTNLAVGVQRINNTERILRAKWLGTEEFLSMLPPEAAVYPDGMIFSPYGFFTYKVEVSQPGATIQMRVWLTQPLPPNAVIYKYDQIREWYIPASIQISEDRRSIVLAAKDGGMGDGDGAENSIIIDPFGIAIPAGQQYTVTFAAGPNGTVEGNLSQTVVVGESTTAVTAVPNQGYVFKNWTGSGFISTANPVVLPGVFSDMAITANFEAVPPGPFTVTFTAGANGSIDGGLTQTVPGGGSTTPVTAVPAEGYRFVNWTGTGGFVTSTNNPLTVTNVVADMNITANFEKLPEEFVTVTFAAGAGGTLTGNVNQTIAKGGSTTPVTAVPDSRYVFKNWTGTGGFTSADNPLTLTNVTSDMEITANFEECVGGPFTITFRAGVNGTLQGNQSQTVLCNGSTTAVRAVANSGYRFKNWTGTGGFTSTNNPLIVTNISKDMEILATFEAIPSKDDGGSDNCFINSSSGSGGSIGIVLMALVGLLSLLFLGKREK